MAGMAKVASSDADHWYDVGSPEKDNCDLAGAPPDQRKAHYAAVGNTLARSIGAQLARKMIAARGITLDELEKIHGFKPKVISNLTNGKTVTGPKLTTLFELAEALGFDLHLDVLDQTDP